MGCIVGDAEFVAVGAADRVSVGAVVGESVGAVVGSIPQLSGGFSDNSHTCC